MIYSHLKQLILTESIHYTIMSWKVKAFSLESRSPDWSSMVTLAKNHIPVAHPANQLQTPSQSEESF
jgi:hypothetical protein